MVKNLTSMFEYLSDIVKSAYIILEKGTIEGERKRRKGSGNRMGIAESRGVEE